MRPIAILLTHMAVFVAGAIAGAAGILLWLNHYM